MSIVRPNALGRVRGPLLGNLGARDGQHGYGGSAHHGVAALCYSARRLRGWGRQASGVSASGRLPALRFLPSCRK